MSSESPLAVPDGGWGWLVVVAATIEMFVIPGINRSCSLIIESWRVRFSASAAATSTSFTIYNIISMISGPLCSMGTSKFGVRAVTLAGALLVTLGLLGSAYAPNLYVIYLTFGGLMGLGRGLVDVGKEVAFSEWFDKHRAKASSFSAVSAGIGTIVMAPLIQICIEEYGSSGAMLILAGFGLHLVISGALMRSPYTYEISRKSRSVALQTTEDASGITSINDVEMDLKTDDQHMDSVDLKPVYTECEGQPGIDGPTQNSSINDNYSTASNNRFAENNTESKTQNGDISYLESKSPNVSVKHTPRKSYGCLTSKYFNIYLFKNSHFLAYCLIMGTSKASSSMLFALFAGLATERGISIRNSSYLIAVTGVIIILTRIITGIIFDMKSVRGYRKEIMGVIYLVMGISMTAFSQIYNIPGMLTGWGIYVCAQAVFGVLYAVPLNDIISRDDYVSALGIIRFVQGFGFIMGPTFGGYLKDVTGLYDATFLSGGLMNLIPAVLYLVIMLMGRMRGEKISS